MCGIVGYVGHRPAEDILLSGLEKLEYRGYDSAGISLQGEGRLDAVRAVGNLANLRTAVQAVGAGSAAGSVALAEPPATTGIGHTRWATHGRVTQENAHPHFDTVDRVRNALHAISGADTRVGGNSAVNHDVQDASAADNRLIIPIILVAVFLILAVLLRALVAPLVLLATVVLSFGAAIGISGFVFKNVFGFAGADSSFPLFAFVFLVALGIDYNIFLMTRVREEALKFGTRRGALIGIGATGGVITSAGLVLAGTFAALGSLPIVFMAELGFAVAVGVLLDTIIVRSVLVTALNLDLGRHMWWPSQLAQKGDVETPSAEVLIEEPVRV